MRSTRLGTELSGCKALARALAIILGVVVFCAPMLSQANFGRILGSVHDPSGGVIVGATVTITDVSRGIPRTVTTDEAGEYVAPNLLPSTYKIHVDFKGFKAVERPNILLEVGKDARIDFELQPGAATETITISEQTPMLDTTSATLGGTLSNETINDLPLNGRNYQNLLALRPGTMVYPGGGPWTQSTNGIRPEGMGYVVDGVANDEAFMGLSVTNAAAVAGDAATLMPIDAIQEFNTQVNPKAEFGWKPGAVTSVGLKSGTNDFHGTAYAFGRTDAWDARNFFNPVGQAKQPVELEQYGSTAGGHIIRDKLFYFGGYEGQRYTVGNSFTYNLPSPAAGGGAGVSLPDAIMGVQAAGLTPSPLSLKLVGCTLGPPITCTAGIYGPFASVPLNQGGFPNTNKSDNGLGKIDYHINDRHTVSGSYFLGNDKLLAEDAPETLAQFETSIHSRAQAVAGHWTWTPSSRWVNELRVGYTRYTLTIIPVDSKNNAFTTYGINTGVTNPVLAGLPNLKVGGFSEAGGFHNFPKIVGPDNTYSFIENLSYLRGNHAYKFGGELRNIRVHQGTFRNGRGRIRFGQRDAFAATCPPTLSPCATALEDFIAGVVGRVDLLAGDPTRDLSQWNYAGFAQDDWRLTPKVTVNLGLRYEYSTPPTESHNKLGNFEPGKGLEQVGKNIGSLYKGDHTNFSPRLGVAWDVTGKGTTVVRAGYSLIYELLTMNVLMSQQNTNNTVTLGVGVIPTGAALYANSSQIASPGNIVATGISLPGSLVTPNWQNNSASVPLYPASATSLVTCGDGSAPPLGLLKAGPCSIMAMDRNYRTPFVQNWTLGVQHAFTNYLSLEVGYVGNHGSRLTGIRDINQADPATGVRPLDNSFPYLGFVNFLSNLYRSNYNGLQSTLTARNYHGLDVVVGYTYSHALDQMSYNWNQYLPQDSRHPELEYGASDFDIRHRFTLSLTYNIPGRKGFAQMLEGWKINSIVTLQTPQPWNSFDSGDDISGTGENADRWNFFGKAEDFKSRGPNPIPFIGGSNFNVDINPANATFMHVIGVVVGSPSAATTCFSHATSQAAKDQLGALGCYAAGNSVMIPPAHGTFGNMGRNVFRDTGFKNLDLSVAKTFKFGERFSAQFRAEAFNILNHTNFANPWGGTSGYGGGATADPSAPGLFGCGCATPDVASANPVLGSGSNRAIQLGLKLIW